MEEEFAMDRSRKFITVQIVILMLTLVIAGCVQAADDVVDIYLFRGEGCSHCAELEPYLQSLKDGVYKDKINIHEYEIWYDEDNALLADQFCDAYGVTSNGVPMTFVGSQFLSGYSENMQQDFRNAIDTELERGPVDPQDIVDGKVVDIYLFWGDGCPHCEEEKPFLYSLAQNEYRGRLAIHEYEVWYNDGNAMMGELFTKAYGREVTGVPATFIGAHFFAGFNESYIEDMTAAIEEELAFGPVNPQKIASGKITLEEIEKAR